MAISENEKKVLARAERILLREVKDGDVMSSPDQVRKYLRYKHAGLENEVFSVLILDNRHRVIEAVDLAQGTIDGAAVYPREVVKAVLYHNGAACLFSHGHPSGVCEPSQADINITKKLTEALALIDVRVLDHCVVGNPEITSLAERGLL